MAGKKSYPKKLYIDLFTGNVANSSIFSSNTRTCANNKQRFRFVGLAFTYKTLKTYDELGFWRVVWVKGHIHKRFQKIYENRKINHHV